MCSATIVMSQANTQLLSLDSYKIPMNSKGAVIGHFLPTTETISLVEDSSGLFMIDEKNNLCLKKNKEIKSTSPMIYTIRVKQGGIEKDFDLVVDEFIRNRVIAHRGGWKYHDVHQNSLGSLRKAIELGCEASEFDVWLTKDKVVALNHDYEFDGMIVELTNLANMRQVKLEGGEVMVTLTQYLDLIRTQNKTRLVLEIKSVNKAKALELTDSVVNIVHRMKAQAWVDYISFDYEVLKRVRSLDPTAHIAYLGADVPLDLQKIEGISGIDYHFSQFDKMPRLYDRARMLGLSINVWTINDKEMLEKFLNMNVDYITTDEPKMLIDLINTQKKSDRAR